MDTCGYIQEICNADFRSTATDQQRVIFYTSIGELVDGYENYYGAKEKDRLRNNTNG